MNKLEKVEMVREKTGVSYEDARNALEQCEYDVLDAIVLLEQQGKTQQQTAHHTTSYSEPTISSDMVRAQEEYQQSSKKTAFNESFDNIMEGLKKLCARGLEVTFVVERRSVQVMAIPVLLLAILVLFLFPATVPLLIVGLFFGFRYHFEGLNNTSVDVNDVMDHVADQAESFREDVMGRK